jgi:hypothetical protein
MCTMFRHRSSIVTRRWALGIGLWALLAASAASGCAKARAQTVPDGPPLAMPPPPSRVFAPLEEEPLVSSPVPPETTTTTAPGVATAKPPTRKPSPPEPEKPAAPAPTPAPAAEVPRELRAASLPADPESERRITQLVQNALRDLKGVDYGKLTRGGKEQYDQAKGFAEEAEKALRERNFVYAQTAADKAANLASELSGR